MKFYVVQVDGDEFDTYAAKSEDAAKDDREEIREILKDSYTQLNKMLKR